MNTEDLQHLVDRAAISDVVIRYATGLDTRDRALYRSCFTDPVTVDFASWSGRPAATVPVDDWVASVFAVLPGFDATQHLSTNHVITFDGPDEATCVSQMQAQHYLADQPVTTCTLGGHYTNRLVRTARGWKITSCTLTVTWVTGDRGLFAMATERLRARQAD